MLRMIYEHTQEVLIYEMLYKISVLFLDQKPECVCLSTAFIGILNSVILQ